MEKKSINVSSPTINCAIIIPFNKITVFKRKMFERLLWFNSLVRLSVYSVNGHRSSICQSGRADTQTTIKHFRLFRA